MEVNFRGPDSFMSQKSADRFQRYLVLVHEVAGHEMSDRMKAVIFGEGHYSFVFPDRTFVLLLESSDLFRGSLNPSRPDRGAAGPFADRPHHLRPLLISVSLSLIGNRVPEYPSILLAGFPSPLEDIIQIVVHRLDGRLIGAVFAFPCP